MRHCGHHSRIQAQHRYGIGIGEGSLLALLWDPSSLDNPLGQTTIDYTSRNISIVRNIIEAMTPFRSDTILLVVANPVDLLTSIAQELSGLPASQVLGSGTFLDSVRLRGLMADRAGVSSTWPLHPLSSDANGALGSGKVDRYSCVGRARRSSSCSLVGGNNWRRPHRQISAP